MPIWPSTPQFLHRAGLLTGFGTSPRSGHVVLLWPCSEKSNIVGVDAVVTSLGRNSRTPLGHAAAVRSHRARAGEGRRACGSAAGPPSLTPLLLSYWTRYNRSLLQARSGFEPQSGLTEQALTGQSILLGAAATNLNLQESFFTTKKHCLTFSMCGK